MHKPKTTQELKDLLLDRSISLGEIDVSEIVDMSELFYQSTRDDFSGIESWNVSNVKDMSKMFEEAKRFDEPIGEWNVSNVKDMSQMFKGAKIFDQDLSKWDVSNVRDMSEMFKDAKSFDQDISSWNLAKLKDTEGMFEGAKSFEQDLSQWGDLNPFGTSATPSCATAPKDSKQTTPTTTPTSFCKKYSPSSKEELKALVQDPNIALGEIDVSKITDMSYLFAIDKEILTQIENLMRSLTNFWDCDTELPILKKIKKEYKHDDWFTFLNANPHWQWSTFPRVAEMFVEVLELINNGEKIYHKDELPTKKEEIHQLLEFFKSPKYFNRDYNGIETWDVSNVKTMEGMFSRNYAFNHPIENWDVSNVKNMSFMFSWTFFNQPLQSWKLNSLQSARGMFASAFIFNQSLNDWNMSSVKDMHAMFWCAEEFNQPIGNWDVSNVEDMSEMFKEAKSFNQPIENWNVGNVSNMANMFYGAKSFNQPIGNWDVSNVIDMRSMFSQAESFNQPIGNWDVGNVYEMSSMFCLAKSFNQPLNDWDVSSMGEDCGDQMFSNADSFDFDNIAGWWFTNNKLYLKIRGS